MADITITSEELAEFRYTRLKEIQNRFVCNRFMSTSTRDFMSDKLAALTDPDKEDLNKAEAYNTLMAIKRDSLLNVQDNN